MGFAHLLLHRNEHRVEQAFFSFCLEYDTDVRTPNAEIENPGYLNLTRNPLLSACTRVWHRQRIPSDIFL